MIRLHNITKTFGDQEVLKGISAEFLPGKCNLIIGLSGSGKTVLLKSIIGLHEPTSGTVEFGDQVVQELNRKELKKLRQETGVVFQASALFTSLSVVDNVRLPLQFFSDMSKEEMEARVNFCLERVRIPEEAYDKNPAELSGGMQKRVAIARAIVLKPKYLFCDEPNSGLDPETAIVIDELIQSITEEFGMTTVINTHDMNSVLEIGDHVILLKDGYKVWEGNRKDIIDSDNQYVVDYVFRSKLFRKLKKAIQLGEVKS